jgi:phosphatidylcholine synthase
MSSDLRLAPEMPPFSPVRRFLAWCVHFYTALGLVAAGGIAVALVEGGPHSFRLAFGLMAVALLIDGTDGTFARRVHVKEVLPRFDGRRLDDLVDFQTYTLLPLLLVFQAGLLPEGQEFWLLFPLLASAYGFSQADAKSADGYFVGFPSYWNVIAFYLYILEPPAGLTIGVLLTFSVLTFVPARYLYPTFPGKWNRLAALLGVAWGVVLAWILFLLPEHTGTDPHADQTGRLLALLSLVYPAFYLAVSWGISVGRFRRLRRSRAGGGASSAKPQGESSSLGGRLS